ncbi:MAG: MBL fold metallo-hydrolase [Planctomycetaceae bacterium]
MTKRELTLLGTGTSVGVPMIGCDCDTCTSTNPRNHRTRTGVFVPAPEGNFLIDTSPELRVQLLRENVNLVHAALFTHSHADHIFGLDDLRIFGHYLDGPVTLYCEESVEQQLRKSFGYAFRPPKPNAHHFSIPKLRFERVTLEPFDVLGLQVVPIRLMHGELPILGYRIGNVAFCTDVSHIPDQSWPMLEGIDVLVIDAVRDRPHPTHFNVSQALEVVDRLKPRQTYFTHISHWLEYESTNARLPENVELAYDGLRIPF